MKILWIFILPLAHAAVIKLLSDRENIALRATCGRKHPLYQGNFPRQSPYKMKRGTKVKPFEFPFVVGIREVQRRPRAWNVYWSTEMYPHCSAVLISKRHVLTAAHCVVFPKHGEDYRASFCGKGGDPRSLQKRYVKKEDLDIYVGTRCPQPGPCTPKRTVYRADRILFHPLYHMCMFTYDIAIIELSQDVDEYDGIPICMPNGVKDIIPNTVMGVGYGTDPSINKMKPGLQVAQFREWHDDYQPLQIITVGQDLGMCQGDSGGPLLYEKNGRYTLLGIASHSHTNDNCTLSIVNRSGHYTDVRKFLGWICHYTGICPDEGDGNPSDVYGN